MLISVVPDLNEEGVVGENRVRSVPIGGLEIRVFLRLILLWIIRQRMP